MSRFQSCFLSTRNVRAVRASEMDPSSGFGHLRPELRELSGFDRDALASRSPAILRPIMDEHLLEVCRLARIQFVKRPLCSCSCDTGFCSPDENASGRINFV